MDRTTLEAGKATGGGHGRKALVRAKKTIAQQKSMARKLHGDQGHLHGEKGLIAQSEQGGFSSTIHRGLEADHSRQFSGTSRLFDY